MEYVSVEPSAAGSAELTPAAAHAGLWRVFVRRFLLLLIALVVFIGLLNFIVSPEGIYPTALLPPVTWNMRANKAELLAKANPEALLLGSSRLMMVKPSEVERATGLRTFNAAVNAAYAEDFYVLLRYAEERGHAQPKLVIIGVDVEAFHDHEPENEYLLQPNALGAFLQKGEARGAGWRRFTHLFTVYQTKLSFISLFQRMGGKRGSNVEFNLDGSPVEDPWKKQIREGRFDRAKGLQAMITQYIGRWKSYTGLSSDRVDFLAAAVRYARAHGARVVVMATPIHPELRQALAAYGYEERENLVHDDLRRLAQEEGAEFVDLSRPEIYGGTPEHFYDGVHQDEYNAERLMAAALGKHAVQ